MSEPKLPNPGKGRFWVIEHQPQKKTTPLRIELRERTIKDSARNVKSLSRLIGYGDTVADSEKVYIEAEKVLVRAGNADRFVGTWSGEKRKKCFHGDVVEIGTEPDGSAIYRCRDCEDIWNESED